jgi:hypothetical protein
MTTNFTVDELDEILEAELEDADLIGTEVERKNYYPAIMGVDRNAGRVAYDRKRLVECFMDTHGLTAEEADEWVSCNVERSIPYWGEHSPVILDETFQVN